MEMSVWLFSFFFLSGRNMLHNLSLHMCGWDQLWTVPLPSLHVWDTRGYQSWLWLVYVLCMGWTGPHVAGWFPVYTRSFALSSSHPCCAQAQAGERLRVTGCHSSNRHLSYPETVMSPVPETVSPRDSEHRQRERESLHTEKAHDTGSLSLTWIWKRGDIWLKTISVPLVLFFCPSLWMNCSVLLLALREENSYTKIFFL